MITAEETLHPHCLMNFCFITIVSVLLSGDGKPEKLSKHIIKLVLS